MKWIGQHIWDLTSRFRGDVYLEDLQGSTDVNTTEQWLVYQAQQNIGWRWLSSRRRNNKLT
jgi:hypothetical protein